MKNNNKTTTTSSSKTLFACRYITDSGAMAYGVTVDMRSAVKAHLTVTPVLLPATTATRQRRIDTASARHHIETEPVIIAAADVVITIDSLQRHGDKCAYYTLRARGQNNQLMRDLMAEYYNDKTARSGAALAENADDMRSVAATMRSRAADAAKTAKRNQRIADKTGSSAAEILTATAAARDAARANELYSDAATDAADNAADIDKLITGSAAATSSTREDLAQDAIAATLAAIVDMTPAVELVHVGCQGCSAGIKRLAAGDALDRSRTKHYPMTDAEAAAYIALYGYKLDSNGRPILTEGAASPVRAKDSRSQYDTIKFYPATDTTPAHWERIRHYHTAAPVISMDVYDRSEQTEALITNAAMNAAQTQTDIDRFFALCAAVSSDGATNRKGRSLTERDRQFIAHLAQIENGSTPTGRAYAAAHAAARKAGKSWTEAEKDAAAAAIEKALDMTGLTAAVSRRAYLSRIRDRAAAAIAAIQEDELNRIAEDISAARDAAATAAEAAERRFNRFRALMRHTPGGRAQQPRKVDLIAWTERQPQRRRAYATDNQTAAITWQPLTQQPQTLTAAEAAAIATERERVRAAHIAAHADDIAILDYRRSLTAPRRSPTAFPALDAQAAALAIFDHMSRTEQLQTIAAARAEAAALADIQAAERRIKAAAAAKQQRPKITVAEFNRQTPTQRSAFLTACNYCFDIVR